MTMEERRLLDCCCILVNMEHEFLTNYRFYYAVGEMNKFPIRQLQPEVTNLYHFLLALLRIPNIIFTIQAELHPLHYYFYTLLLSAKLICVLQ